MRYADWLLDLAIGGQNLHSMFEDLGIQFAQHADAVVPGFVDHDDVGPLAGVIAETKVVEQVPPRLAQPAMDDGYFEPTIVTAPKNRRRNGAAASGRSTAINTTTAHRTRVGASSKR
jgi:hypothetical protein